VRALTLVEAAVPILLGLFEAPLFTPENTFTEIVFDPYRIFDKPLDRNLVETRNLLEDGSGPEIDATSHLVLYVLKNLLLISLHTYYTFGAFKGFENRARNALRASTSAELDVLTINFLSKIKSALTRGSKRSCTGFLNWFVK
jgi:hypothetical protein